MECKFVFFLILLMLISVLIPDVLGSTVETRYMCNQASDISNYYVLGTNQTVSYVSRKLAQWQTEEYLGIRVYKRNQAGGETEITSATVAKVYPPGTGESSNTWNCPQTSLASTDRVVVKVIYYTVDVGENIVASFATEALGAGQLDSTTWTVYYHVFKSGNTYYFRFGTTTYNSRITNFTWTEAGSPQEVKFSFTESVNTTATFNYWREQKHTFVETLYPASNFQYRQEKLYDFAESAKPTSMINYAVEKQIQFWQHAYIEHITILNFFSYQILGTAIINYVAFALSFLGLTLTFPCIVGEQKEKVLAVIALTFSLGALAFSLLGLSFAFPVAILSLILSLCALALYFVNKS